MIVKLFTKRQPGNYKRNKHNLLTGCKHIVFRPVFNIADSSITIVVLLMILFQKQFFHPAEVTETAERKEDGEAPLVQ